MECCVNDQSNGQAWRLRHLDYREELFLALLNRDHQSALTSRLESIHILGKA